MCCSDFFSVVKLFSYFSGCVLPMVKVERRTHHAHNHLCSYVPAHDKTYNKTCVTSKDSDQPV